MKQRRWMIAVAICFAMFSSTTSFAQDTSAEDEAFMLTTTYVLLVYGLPISIVVGGAASTLGTSIGGGLVLSQRTVEPKKAAQLNHYIERNQRQIAQDAALAHNASFNEMAFIIGVQPKRSLSKFARSHRKEIMKVVAMTPGQKRGQAMYSVMRTMLLQSHQR